MGWWWLVVSLLGWIAWPMAFSLFRGLRDRGFLLSKTFGWLLSGWLLWVFASAGLAQNSVRNSWLVAGDRHVLVSAAVLVFTWREVLSFLRRMWGILLVGEGSVRGSRILFFVLIRRANPDIWQPWFGGEKFMEFAFLNGILRSPYFPPVDPHFAGGYINYYYYGIYLVGYLIKLTGIYAEVAFNLAIPMLFALTVVNAFAVVLFCKRDSAAGEMRMGRQAASRRGAAVAHPEPMEENVRSFAAGTVAKRTGVRGIDSLAGQSDGLTGVDELRHHGALTTQLGGCSPHWALERGARPEATGSISFDTGGDFGRGV